MSKPQFHSSILAETAHAVCPTQSLRGLMAGLTVLAVGVTLILGTALPVQADRKAAVCAQSLTGPGDAKACMYHP